MNPAESPSKTLDDSMLPRARIDAQDEIFALPVREYLETNGCAVYVNNPAIHSITYHIVVGAIDFVKDIFSKNNIPSVRRMGIVMDTQHNDAEKLSREFGKIVVVDPVYLGSQDIIEIFSFFFSSDSHYLDKRRNVHEPGNIRERPADVPVIFPGKIQSFKTENIQQKEDTQTKEDKKRIDAIVAEVFENEIIRRKNSGKHTIRTGRQRFTGFITKFLITVLCILSPLVWYTVSVSGTGIFYGIAAQKFQQGDIQYADVYIQAGNFWLAQSKVSSSVITTPLVIIGWEDVARNQERFVSLLGDFSSLLAELKTVVNQGREVTTLLLSGKNEGNSLAGTLVELHTSVQTLSTSCGLAMAQMQVFLENKTFPFSLRYLHDIGTKAYQMLGSSRAALVLLDHILMLYPRMAGFEKSAKYLVLLQNSNELRPTGGFIGSIANVTFEDGFMSEFAIQDVYAIDGQLKGHVDPPGPIRELLTQEHWYLRDSNWDPDFEISGEKAAWFYQKETGEVVDGVMAISVPFVVDLLGVTGPITLSDYDDRITQENFFGKSVYYTQSNFFPGSTQKSDFLGSLSRAVVQSLTMKGAAEPVALFHALMNGFNRKDIQLYFPDSEKEELARQFQWAGNVFAQPGCSGVMKGSCVRDPIGIYDANLSVSKVNYFITRSSIREVTIDPSGTIRETISLTTENTAQDTTPGISGPYLSYLRFYLPPDAWVDNLLLDGTPVPSRDTTKRDVPQLPYTERESDTSQAQVVAAVTQLPPGSTQTLEIQYHRDGILNMYNQRAVLDFSFDKQGGVQPMEQALRIHIPESWKASILTGTDRQTQPVIANNGKLEYNTTVSRDQLIRLTITK